MLHIEHRPKANLLKPNESHASGICSFVDIFSEKNLFMIVSKRDDKSAPWKQFLTPIWEEKDNNHGNIIYLLKKYFISSMTSDEKKEISDQIYYMGENALLIAETYGINAYGEIEDMSPGEYLQQGLLKWLLLCIPTVAIFMSLDGNTRVNIIYNQTFPFIFTNEEAKKLIIRRIMSIAKNYGIQRFSIPAWQKLEYLSCKELPYSHYFVKRGYFSEESFTKVIFPFDSSELLDITDNIFSQETQEKMHYLEQLFEALDIRKQLFQILPDSKGRIELMINNIKEEEKREYLKKAIGAFIDGLNSGGKSIERVFDRVRINYRNMVSGTIGNVKDIEKLSYDEILFDMEKWEDVYLYILVISIAIVCSIELSQTEFPVPTEQLTELCQVWRYVIDKQYLYNYMKVEQYELNYFSMLKSGKGKTFDKKERIISYIMYSRNGELSKDFFEACWERYISEIFEIFKSLVEDQFRSLEELLPDKPGIELRMKKEEKGTKDGDK